MDLAILGEYGLKTALQVALNIKKLYTSEVDDGIIVAFNFALNDWSKHDSYSSDRSRLMNALKGYLETPTSYEALDLDTRAFIDCFKKRLSEQPAAHRYLMTLRSGMQAKGQEQILLEQYKTQESVLDLKSRMEELNMAPQYIRALLKELPLEQGLEPTELALEEMLTNGRIHSEGAKRLVLEFVRFLFEHTDKITEETKLLREAGDSYLAETLEDIKKVLTGESEQSLTDVHKKYQEQVRQDEIRVLKELIEAAQIQFSFREAREFYERLIELSPTSEHHFNYAHLLYSLNDFKIARKHYEKVLQALRELAKHNPEVCKPDVAASLNGLGSVLGKANEFDQAQSCCEEALDIYSELFEQDPEAYKPYVATVLNNLGALHQKTNDLKRAQSCYKDVLKIYQDLSEHNPEAYKPYVATVLNNLGGLHHKTNDLKQAQSCCEEALDIYSELFEHNPEVYKPDVAMTLNNLGYLLEKTNDLKQSQTYYEDTLKLYLELSEQNPEAYKPYVATVLNNLGGLHHKTNDLKQAQSCYEEALDIYRVLFEHNPEAYKPDVAMALNNLGNLFTDINDLKQAQSCCEEALEIYRELSEHNPEAYKPYVAMVLNNVGRLLEKTNDLKQAQAYSEEALDIYSELFEHNPEGYKPDVAMTQRNLMLLYQQLGKEEEAEMAYLEAHDIFQDLASQHPRAYEINYAKILVMGFDLLGKPKEDLEEAKEILGKYPEHPETQKFLFVIEHLDKR